jgi:hypothetical protein
MFTAGACQGIARRTRSASGPGGGSPWVRPRRLDPEDSEAKWVSRNAKRRRGKTRERYAPVTTVTSSE